jgi:hypothetical chaperone protein
VFYDLATWHLIQWQYSPKALRDAQALRTDYRDPQLHQRLMAVLEERLGHRLADAVEQAKIQASSTGGDALLDLGWLETGLQTGITQDGCTARCRHRWCRWWSAQHCVQLAGLPAGGVDAIYLTGGSSALRTLRDALAQAFPAVPQVEGDLFGGVATGLAYA